MSSDKPFLIKDYAGLVQDMLEGLASGSGGRTRLTDATEGSVVRTLMEVFARELAVCYQQLDTVYKFAFLDTAEGVALDNVVALLGLSRRKPGHIEGSITFKRQTPANEDINIRAGTLISGRDVQLFSTVNRITLDKGATQVTTDIRSLEPGKDPIKPGQLNIMPRPVLGIESVFNETELQLRSKEETDEELRERARDALYHASRGTIPSLEVAVRSLGISEVKVYDQLQDKPGEVDVILGDKNIDDILFSRVQAEVESVRPAGVIVNLRRATWVWIEITAMVELDQKYDDNVLEKIHAEIVESIAKYIDSLGNGERMRWSKINNILSTHDSVHNIYPLEDIRYTSCYIYAQDPAEPTGPLVKKDMSSDYVLTNNDINIGPNDRIGLENGVQSLFIRLEPPFLDIWMDIELKPEVSNIEGDVIAPLNNIIESINSSLSTSESKEIQLSYTDIFDTEKNKLSSYVDRIILVHSGGDGLIAEFLPDRGKDTIRAKERITLRNIKTGDMVSG